MFHVVLYEPEIPANTGNIGRLCVAVNATLHIIGRPGFSLDDRHVRRAGLDYWRFVRLEQHADLAGFVAAHPDSRLFYLSARARKPYTEVRFQKGDAFVFGSESRGLPPEVLARNAEQTLVIPILSDKVRSLNLSGSVSIVVYEALRQVGAWSPSADK